ncbi:C-terminal binding protein [Erysipelothrix urinaevulpis]|uniref:C-terminal binding protein n=1 Tax=Erysipelothrix urinaevulpis TaxID=2683717 RepID=UPI00135739AB|nr:C-terminal binding protein [Erysipelothrix urinaevulpis]
MKIYRLFEEDGTFEAQKEMVGDKAEIILSVSPTEEDIIKNAHDADFIICGYEKITPKVMDSLPNLKMVAFQSIGTNGIDLKEANERNMPVSNIPHYCIEEVSDYVIACIFAHNRRLIQYNDSVKREHNWIYDEFPNMRRINNQTIGFLGLGNIPRLVVKKLAAFGCEMIAYDPFVDEKTFKELGVKSASMEEIFETSDIISCHLPLNSATDKVINKDLFALTTKAPAFVNSARGGVVNEEDLLEALNNGKISYAYLDVLSTEYPVLEEEPLVNHKNTIVTPHAAFYSLDSMEQSGTDSVKNILNYISGNYDEIDLVNRRDIELGGKK